MSAPPRDDPSPADATPGPGHAGEPGQPTATGPSGEAIGPSETPDTPGQHLERAAQDADLLVVDGKVSVTMDVTAIPDERAETFVGSNLLLVWDRDAPEEVRAVLHLPRDIDPQSAFVSIQNGVLDMSADERDAGGPGVPHANQVQDPAQDPAQDPTQDPTSEASVHGSHASSSAPDVTHHDDAPTSDRGRDVVEGSDLHAVVRSSWWSHGVRPTGLAFTHPVPPIPSSAHTTTPWGSSL